MKEEFLYYIWQYKLFTSLTLFTHDNLKVEIKNCGKRNNNSGPDFLNAQVFIDHQLWVGNIEIHVKSSDWYAHQHENDENFDAVILHVVWDHDVEVFMKNNKPLPTLVLKDYVSKQLLKNYKELMYSNLNFIPCENQINIVDEFVLKNWLERLYFERLTNKSELILSILKETNQDFEATLFQLLARNFGLKTNGDAFLKLAKSIDFSIIRKEQFELIKITALLFGQAGFLDEDIENSYFKLLKTEYDYLKHKYSLTQISKSSFQFFRMRPNNFPTIRIAQFTSLLHQHKNLFSKILDLTSLTEFYTLFKIDVDVFWKTHYTFTSESKKSAKQLTKSFVDLLLINTIIPLKFVYLKSIGKDFEDDILLLIQQISSEKNSIVDGFKNLKISCNNAMESQALLTLKNNYCTKKRCLHCAIGNNLIKE
ncbi:MAG: DUF2851 family protein [Flavobacteriaceae bacterium]|nr:DUF2851 family protein [Flavobacteriaceae bacterium]